MNCEQIDVVLDTNAAAELEVAAGEAVRQHLASCTECREAWVVYRELVAERIPKTPRALGARIDAALAARTAAEAPRARPWLAVGIVLVAGAAAAAAAIAWRFVEPAPGLAPPVELKQTPAARTPTGPKPTPLPDSGTAGAVAGNEAAAPPSPDAADPTRFALDAQSVVVLVTQYPPLEADVAAALARCRDEVVSHLRAVGLNVIADDRVPGLTESGPSAWEIARELGAGTAVAVGAVAHETSCRVQQIDAGSGDVRWDGLRFSSRELDPDPWPSFAASIAEHVRDSLRDQSTVLLEAQAAVLDTALGDRERVNALRKLLSGLVPFPEAHDPAVVAAAFEIATKSRDAEARESAWMWIRSLDVHDPQLLPSLLAALAYDPADGVRYVAARALGTHLDEPGVRDALARAVAEDPQQSPEHPCCLLTVREAARRALLSGEEPRAAVRQILFDETLPPHDRLMLSTPDGVFLSLASLGDDAAQAVFAIGARATDPDIRWTAWFLLIGVRDPSFAPTLLDDLAHHPSHDVRSWAAAALVRYGDDPAVRAALERAQRDAAADVQLAARAALAGGGGSKVER